MIMHILLTITFIISTITGSVNMDCDWDDDYVNDWDGNHDSVKRDSYFAGMESYHSNHYEDRRYKWRYCKPRSPEPQIGSFIGSKSIELAETSLDEEWTKSCKPYNSGDAAIHGIESSHSNHYEDRKWTISCGLLDRNQYKLTNCRWNYYGNMGGWDDDIDYQCRNNGVLRSIRSRNWDNVSDRQFRVECCNIEEADYSFINIQGYWDLKGSCQGCDSHSYSVSYGVSRTTGKEISNAFEASLSVSVSAGFEAGLPGGSVNGGIEVTASIAQSVSNTMSASFSRDKSEEWEYNCNQKHLYQWVMEAYESGPYGSGHVYIPSNIFMCTDNDDDPNTADSNGNPNCVPGDCGEFTPSPTNFLNLPDLPFEFPF